MLAIPSFGFRRATFLFKKAEIHCRLLISAFFHQSLCFAGNNS